MKCRKCSVEYRRTPGEVKRWRHTCKACESQYHKEWRARRAAEGRPVKGGKVSPEKQKIYAKEYNKRPEVKKRAAERMRKYTNDPRLRMRHEARWQARRAVASGKIKKIPCVKCGERKSEMHHPDYYKPLDVVWLCVKCHDAEHRSLAKQAP